MATAAAVTPPQPRQRTRSMLSFTSKKSAGSQRSVSSPRKIDLTETSAEKSKNRIKTKADPTLAMNEEQPSDVAVGGHNLESIRAIQHRDLQGNLIVDPDRSNPTRSRWERPLDTIRSFEAAIDGNYASSRPRRADPTEVANGYSRRSSYHQGYQNHPAVRLTHDNQSYYGNRPPRGRMESYMDAQHHGPMPYHRHRMPPRMASEPAPMGHPMGPPMMNHPSHPIYPTQGYQRSYDTVASASGTGSNVTDQWGNSTDPSSENSSIDRMQPAPKPDLGEVYGFSGFGGAPELHSPGYAPPMPSAAPHAEQTPHGRTPVMTRYESAGPSAAPGPPPKVPPHGPSSPNFRMPIKLGKPAPSTTGPSAEPEKRKSFFKRFGRGGG